MASATLRVIDEALSLPEDVERAWAEEVERRVAQAEADSEQLVEGEAVLARLRLRYA